MDSVNECRSPPVIVRAGSRDGGTTSSVNDCSVFSNLECWILFVDKIFFSVALWSRVFRNARNRPGTPDTTGVAQTGAPVTRLIYLGR